MSWRNKILPMFTHYTEQARNSQMAALAEENDLAEEEGFTCVPDDKRGHGWCKFHKDRTTVWSCSHGWARAVLDDTDSFTNHRYYHTLSQALRNEKPHARREGNRVVPIEVPDDAANL